MYVALFFQQTFETGLRPVCKWENRFREGLAHGYIISRWQSQIPSFSAPTGRSVHVERFVGVRGAVYVDAFMDDDLHSRKRVLDENGRRDKVASSIRFRLPPHPEVPNLCASPRPSGSSPRLRLLGAPLDG